MENDGVKQCVKCKETKPLTEFYKDRGRVVKDCKKCRIQGVVAYQRTEIGKASNRRAQDKHRYGLEAGGYEALLEVQAGCCAICGSRVSRNPRSDRFSIDHCHKTGRVRGLLCLRCNSNLGWFETHQASVRKYLES